MVLSAQDDLDTRRQAAEQGDAAGAATTLGSCMTTARVSSKDDAEAVKWFRLAAEQGYAKAQVELGYRYRWGLGVPSDDAEAGRWLRLAAEQGHAKAQIEMALSYSQDDAEAVRWVRLAADQGDADGTVQSRAHAYANGAGHPQGRSRSREMVPPRRRPGLTRHAQLQSRGPHTPTGKGVLKDDAEAVTLVPAGRRAGSTPMRSSTSGSCILRGAR